MQCEDRTCAGSIAVEQGYRGRGALCRLTIVSAGRGDEVGCPGMAWRLSDRVQGVRQQPLLKIRSNAQTKAGRVRAPSPEGGSDD